VWAVSQVVERVRIGAFRSKVGSIRGLGNVEHIAHADIGIDPIAQATEYTLSLLMCGGPRAASATYAPVVELIICLASEDDPAAVAVEQDE
jgi:hypothetical protein